MPSLDGGSQHHHDGLYCTFFAGTNYPDQKKKKKIYLRQIKNKEMHSSKCRCTHVILMKDGLDELNIRRSSRGDKFTIVSRALVINSSSSAPKGRRKADQKPFFQSLNVGYIGKDSHTQVAIFKQVFPSMRQ